MDFISTIVFLQFRSWLCYELVAVLAVAVVITSTSAATHPLQLVLFVFIAVVMVVAFRSWFLVVAMVVA